MLFMPGSTTLLKATRPCAGLGMRSGPRYVFPANASLRRVALQSTIRRASSDMAIVKYSEGEDPSKLDQDLAKLLAPNGKWSLCAEGAGIERRFKFKTFKAAWAFMNLVADECKQTRHHPEWSNVYNSCQVRWTTHKPAGLSSKDVHMAGFCDQAAQADGSTEVEDA